MEMSHNRVQSCTHVKLQDVSLVHNSSIALGLYRVFYALTISTVTMATTVQTNRFFPIQESINFTIPRFLYV